MIQVNPKVVDLYHEDGEPDFERAWDDGIRGIIHKATEGLAIDPKYHERRDRCYKEVPDMLWGAYHFARQGDPQKQASFFLDTVKASPTHWATTTVYVLDHEDPRFPIWGAISWLRLVRLVTKKLPWLYSDNVIRAQMEHRHPHEFSEYPLWLPEYGPEPKVPQPWTTCILWQYTDGHIGAEPRRIAGMPGGLDISSFQGSDDELRNAWLAV